MKIFCVSNSKCLTYLYQRNKSKKIIIKFKLLSPSHQLNKTFFLTSKILMKCHTKRNFFSCLTALFLFVLKIWKFMAFEGMRNDKKIHFILSLFAPAVKIHCHNISFNETFPEMIFAVFNRFFFLLVVKIVRNICNKDWWEEVSCATTHWILAQGCFALTQFPLSTKASPFMWTEIMQESSRMFASIKLNETWTFPRNNIRCEKRPICYAKLFMRFSFKTKINMQIVFKIENSM